MQDILRYINSVEGVIGSAVFSTTGGVIEHAFPPLIDVNSLKAAARLVEECSHGLQISETLDTFDLRYNDGRIIITQRRRGSPIDKVVSELMILVNSEWGRHLAEHGFVGIYRTQQAGKVKMSTVAAPHQGLGVAQYMWSSSPLRRYVDLLNQRQIIAMLKDGEPAYPKNDPALYAAMRDFDHVSPKRIT